MSSNRPNYSYYSYELAQSSWLDTDNYSRSPPDVSHHRTIAIADAQQDVREHLVNHKS
jgi:hypothetical protein